MISNEKLLERLDSPDNLVNVIHEKLHKGGRTKGATELSPGLRLITGVMAQLGKNTEIAKALRISPQSVSLAKHAKTTDAGVGGSSSPKVDPELKEQLEESKKSLTKTAVDIITQAYGLLPEKMPSASARDLSGIAKDAASVVEKLSDKKENNGLTVIIKAPRERGEDEFDVIEIAGVGESTVKVG